MGFITAVEKAVYMSTEQEQETEIETEREGEKNKELNEAERKMRFNELLVAECLRRDVMDMDKERSIFGDDKNDVLNLLDHRVSTLAADVERAYASC